MVVTNKRVICRKGLLELQTHELKNSKIEGINVSQSIIGRVLDYATISFSGVGTAQVEFKAVISPFATKKQIETIIKD